jgi:hypothetical protein
MALPESDVAAWSLDVREERTNGTWTPKRIVRTPANVGDCPRGPDEPTTRGLVVEHVAADFT